MTGTCRHILIPSNEFNEKAILLSSTKKTILSSANVRLTKLATTTWRVQVRYAALVMSAFGNFINCNTVTKAAETSSAHLSGLTSNY